MQTKILIFLFVSAIIISGSLVVAYLSIINNPNQKQELFITSVSKGSKTDSGIELLINVTFYSPTSFKIFNSPYVGPCLGSTKLINETNWGMNESLIYACPFISNNVNTFGPGTYNTSYPIFLVPLNDNSNVAFPSELQLQVSTMHAEFSSPIFTAKF